MNELWQPEEAPYTGRLETKSKSDGSNSASFMAPDRAIVYISRHTYIQAWYPGLAKVFDEFLDEDILSKHLKASDSNSTLVPEIFDDNSSSPAAQERQENEDVEGFAWGKARGDQLIRLATSNYSSSLLDSQLKM